MSTITRLVLALFPLALIITLSSSAEAGCPGSSVAEVLTHFGLPAGIFPSTVQQFSCTPVEGTNALSLSIQLQGVCKVTREEAGVTNVVECQRKVSGIISPGQLTNVKGVAVKLAAKSPPFDVRLVVAEVRVFHITNSLKFIQFYSSVGVNSPPFPVTLLPSNPSVCDSKAAFDVVAEDDHQDGEAVNRVYDGFGRLLRLVA